MTRPTARVQTSAVRLLTAALGGLLLGAAVLTVYYPASSAPFVFDDAGTIVDNPTIRQLWPLWANDPSGGPILAPRTTAVHGRPLVNLSLAINYAFGRLDPFGYRLVNIAIHLLTAILLWAIVARTLILDHFRGRFEQIAGPLAFAAAIVWALHPLNTECVVYVTQRTELMMGMFYLGTLYLAIRYWSSDGKPARAAWLAAATLSCVSGMLCKEMMASAPAMVLLYERTFLTGSFRRALGRSWPLYLGLSLAWLPVIALNFGGPRTPASGFGLGVVAQEWWFTQAKVLFLYLKLAIWPWPLVIHYHIPYLQTVAEAWPWLLLTGALAVGVLVLFWRRSAVGFVAVWLVAVLSPTLVIPLVNEIAAERRMYVPLAALVPLLIAGGWALWQIGCQRLGWKPTRNTAVATCFAATAPLAIGLACLSSQRLAVYQDELLLWQDAARHQPHDPMVQFNLGTLLAEAGRPAEAITHLERAVELDPDSGEARFNLARALEESGLAQDAALQYRATVALQPDHAAAHYNLARLLEDSGKSAQALEHYQLAVESQPDFAAAHSNLGILLLGTGRTPEAIEHFEAALDGQNDPGNSINLAMAYWMAGRTAEAIPLAEKALNLARTQGDQALAARIETALAQLRAQNK